MTRASHLAAALLLVASASLAQPAPPAPLVREGATVKLAARTYVIPDNSAPMVPNVGIVVGTRGTLVIDPGLGRRNGEAVLREVVKIARTAELYVASTHFHPEHTTGYVAFPATAKYINARVQEAEFGENGAQFIKMFASRSPAVAELLKDATGRKPDVVFDREYALDLGGVRVRMIAVGPTHTKGDTAFFVEGDNVLFAGDVIMNSSFVAANAAHTSVKAWFAAFDTLEGLKPTTIVPSHGPVGGAALIPTLRQAMQEVVSRTRELKATGRTVDDIAATAQKEMESKHPTWGRTAGAAAVARVAYAENP